MQINAHKIEKNRKGMIENLEITFGEGVEQEEPLQITKGKGEDMYSEEEEEEN